MVDRSEATGVFSEHDKNINDDSAEIKNKKRKVFMGVSFFPAKVTPNNQTILIKISFFIENSRIFCNFAASSSKGKK